MFEFRKYPKMTNTYDAKHVKGVVWAMVQKNIPDVWEVTEKIHGANFGCYVKGNDDFNDDSLYITQFASRRLLLSDDESDKFYNFQTIKADIVKKLGELFSLYIDEYPSIDIDTIIVYGELFGGMYIHPDVPTLNQSKVQQGIQYCPDLNFQVFDIFIQTDKEESSFYLSPNMVKFLCHKVKLGVIPAKFSGSLDDCLAYQNDFSSEVHLTYNLPEMNDNICEGIVIKPHLSFYDNRGNRAIFKSKNEKFTERRLQKIKVPIVYSDEDTHQMELVSQYVTLPRLNNIESKIGPLESMSQIGEFMKELSGDVIEDLKYEHDVTLARNAKKHLANECKNLIIKTLQS